MYSLIIKQFIRSRSVQLTIVLIMCMGLVGILTGKQFYTRKQQTIDKVVAHQHEHIQQNVAYHERSMGLLLYYLKFTLVNTPDKLSALSIGQSDVNPGIQSVTIRNLEAQKYDTDLNNPANLLSGNLDLGFVIIYLFPLIVIAFAFNVLSEERERDTWRMVAVQSRSAIHFLLWKLSFRALVIYFVLFVLLVMAVLILSIPLDDYFFAFALVSILYVAFWFALSFWIVSFARSSSFNALVLLSLWVVLAILLPASINNHVSSQYPVPESLGTMIKQRDGYHKKWDEDRQATMQKFYRHYPQFSQYSLSNEEFSYLWYYAMQQMGDDESAAESKAMREKIMAREKSSRSLSQFIPTMHTQLYFNDIARTSLSNHLQFLDRTYQFHERMRLYFYPKIFEEAAVRSEDWNQFRPEFVSIPQPVGWGRGILPLIILSLTIAAWTLFNFRRSSIL